MNTNRCLIFTSPVYPLKITDGGPSGFIAQNLLDEESNFYQISRNIDVSLNNKIKQKIRKILKKDTQKFDSQFLNSFFQYWIQSTQRHFKEIEAQKYKYIYFHDIWSMKACLPLIKDTQTIILQSHCPELPSEEVASTSHFNTFDVEWTKVSEKEAFNRADILIFPNQHIVKIYESLINKKSKIFYIPSGCKKTVNLSKYPLNDKIHLLYIGRRNYIKGFDIVLEGFRQAYNLRKDIELILVGRGDKIQEEGIYDIGFSDAVHHWIYNCDYIVNCNRQSYFDLSILETLSIGTPIIVSYSYGHKEFIDDNPCGIINMGESTVKNFKDILLSSQIRKKRIIRKP